MKRAEFRKDFIPFPGQPHEEFVKVTLSGGGVATATVLAGIETQVHRVEGSNQGDRLLFAMACIAVSRCTPFITGDLTHPAAVEAVGRTFEDVWFYDCASGEPLITDPEFAALALGDFVEDYTLYYDLGIKSPTGSSPAIRFRAPIALPGSLN